MQWWCSAQGVPWEWSWQPFPGVWLFLLLLAFAYRGMARAAHAERGKRADAERGKRALSFAAGLVILWIALDWPVGLLGSGYLASVHMVQFLLIALAAPPLLLYGLPPASLARLRARPTLVRALRGLTHPLVAILLFNVVVVVTHLPSVVDRLMVTQLGSFAIDTAWMAGGLLFWWPVVCPVPERRFPYVAKVGYLILNMILNTGPYLALTFGELPVYAVYELAPPVGSMSAREDQQLAGVLMKVGGGVVLWTAITILFFRWWMAEEGREKAPALR